MQGDRRPRAKLPPMPASSINPQAVASRPDYSFTLLPDYHNKIDPADIKASGTLLDQEKIDILHRELAKEIQASKKGAVQIRYSKKRIREKCGITIPYGIVLLDGKLYAVYKGVKHGKELGKGGFGKAKFAMALEKNNHNSFDVLVLKVIIPKDSAHLAEIKNEARALEITGSGRNVVFEKERSDGERIKTKKYHLLMEWVPGQTVRDILRLEPKPIVERLLVKEPDLKDDESEVLKRFPGYSIEELYEQKQKIAPVRRIDMALMLMKHLLALHSDKRLLHRDIKTPNAIINLRGMTGKNIDLGLATSLPSGSDRAKVPSLIGTEGYIAPELMDAYLAKLTIRHSKKADVYAMGRMLEEIFGIKDIHHVIDIPGATIDFGLFPTELSHNEEIKKIVAGLVAHNPDHRMPLPEAIAALGQVRNKIAPMYPIKIATINAKELAVYSKAQIKRFIDYLKANKVNEVLLTKETALSFNDKTLIQIMKTLENENIVIRSELVSANNISAIGHFLRAVEKHERNPIIANQVSYDPRVGFQATKIDVADPMEEQLVHIKNLIFSLKESKLPEIYEQINVLKKMTTVETNAAKLNAEYLSIRVRQSYDLLPPGPITRSILHHATEAYIRGEMGPLKTVLSLAVDNGYSDLVKILFESHLLDPNQIMNANGDSLLGIAAGKGYYDIAETLLKAGANPDFTQNTRYTPLASAVSNNKSDIVELLIKHHANVNKVSAAGIPSLYYAVATNNVKNVSSLLLAGANPDLKYGKEQVTPHDFAKSKGYTDIFNLLTTTTNKLAFVKQRITELSSQSFSPQLQEKLHFLKSCYSQDYSYQRLTCMLAALQILNYYEKHPQLSSSINITNLANDAFATPASNAGNYLNTFNLFLFKEIQADHAAFVQHLLQTGIIDITQKSLDGDSMLLIACLNHAKTVAQFLLKANADLTPVLESFLANNNEKALRVLLESVTDQKHKMIIEQHILAAIQQGRDDIINLFLKTNLNPDLKLTDGKTLLHHALTQGQSSTVKLLLDQGASPILPSIVQGNPVMPITTAKETGNKDNLKFLNEAMLKSVHHELANLTVKSSSPMQLYERKAIDNLKQLCQGMNYDVTSRLLTAYRQIELTANRFPTQKLGVFQQIANHNLAKQSEAIRKAIASAFEAFAQAPNANIAVQCADQLKQQLEQSLVIAAQKKVGQSFVDQIDQSLKEMNVMGKKTR